MDKLQLITQCKLSYVWQKRAGKAYAGPLHQTQNYELIKNGMRTATHLYIYSKGYTSHATDDGARMRIEPATGCKESAIERQQTLSLPRSLNKICNLEDCPTLSNTVPNQKATSIKRSLCLVMRCSVMRCSMMVSVSRVSCWSCLLRYDGHSSARQHH